MSNSDGEIVSHYRFRTSLRFGWYIGGINLSTELGQKYFRKFLDKNFKQASQPSILPVQILTCLSTEHKDIFRDRTRELLSEFFKIERSQSLKFSDMELLRFLIIIGDPYEYNGAFTKGLDTKEIEAFARLEEIASIGSNQRIKRHLNPAVAEEATRLLDRLLVLADPLSQLEINVSDITDLVVTEMNVRKNDYDITDTGLLPKLLIQVQSAVGVRPELRTRSIKQDHGNSNGSATRRRLPNIAELRIGRNLVLSDH